MAQRHFPPSWQVEQIDGGYVVKDANGQSLAYIYGRETRADGDATNVLTVDEARLIASNIAKLPTLMTIREVCGFMLKLLAITVIIIFATALASHVVSQFLAENH